MCVTAAPDPRAGKVGRFSHPAAHFSFPIIPQRKRRLGTTLIGNKPQQPTAAVCVHAPRWGCTGN